MPEPGPRLPERPAATGILKEAESNPVVKDLLKRFAADIVRREPLDHAAWLAKLRREAERGG